MDFTDYRNPILDAYIQGTQLRRQREKDKFEQGIQTEQQKRLEQQRQDAVKHWEDQLKFQRERLAFDREKETADVAHRKLLDKQTELNMKRLGFEMLASGVMQGNLIPKPHDEGYQGALDEIYNRSRGRLAGEWDVPIEPHVTKGDIELTPGVILKGSEWSTPREIGQAELARRGPLAEKQGEIARARQELVGRQAMERLGVTQEGLTERLGISETGRNERAKLTQEGQNLRLGTKEAGLNTRQQIGIEAKKSAEEIKFERTKERDALKHEFNKDLAEFKAGLQKDRASGKSGQTASRQLALLKTMKEGYQNVYSLGEKSNWRGHSFINAIPLVEEAKAGLDIDDDDVKDYKAALGRITSKEFHELYGSVISQGEAKRAATFIAETWNSPDVARRRLRAAMAEVDLQIRNLEKEVGTGTNSLSTPVNAMESLRRQYAPK